MSNFPISSKTLLSSLLFLALMAGTSWGSIVLSNGTIDAQAGSGGGILGGTATFNLQASEIPDVELLANFFIVDAGVDIVVNGTSLFPQFEDVSQFGPVAVFSGTGESGGGGINSPFGPNSNNLPRLTVNSTSVGTDFSGATFQNSTSTVPYTPVFTVQDFSSLLQSGSNTIEFFVLNNFQGANLQGDFEVTLNAAAVPEPSAIGLAMLAFLTCLASHRRR